MSAPPRLGADPIGRLQSSVFSVDLPRPQGLLPKSIGENFCTRREDVIFGYFKLFSDIGSILIERRAFVVSSLSECLLPRP